MVDHSVAGNVFTRTNARILLRGQYVLFIGDSVQRAAYKDLVALLDDGSLLTDKEKIAKCEDSFRGDRLLAATEKTNGTNFSEIREWIGPIRPNDPNWEKSIMIRFVFTTRVYNEFIEEIFSTLTEDHFPNIICMNSTFWDITRYGDKAEDEHGIVQFPQFQANVDKMCRMINEKAAKAFQNPRKNCPRLDIPCLRIWRSALPISRNARGGLLIPEVTFGDSAEVYRLDMGQANLNIRDILDSNRWDLLDAQFWFRNLQKKTGFREKDGVHWNQVAHRWLSNIFLTHVCNAWGIELPKGITDSPEETMQDVLEMFRDSRLKMNK